MYTWDQQIIILFDLNQTLQLHTSNSILYRRTFNILYIYFYINYNRIPTRPDNSFPVTVLNSFEPKGKSKLLVTPLR